MFQTVPGLLLATALSISLIPLHSQAQSDIAPSHLKGETWAVVVGISDYGDSLNHLSVAAPNAVAVAQWLHKEGFPPVIAEKMILLLDQDGTQANILQALEWVSDHASRDDRVIFYFAGFGSEEALFAYDDPSGETMLAHSSVQSILRQSPSQQMLVIYDLCRPETETSGTQLDIIGKIFRQFVGSGVTVLSSGYPDADEYEYPGMVKSYFTHFFLLGIREEEANLRNDSWITFREVYEFTRLRVLTATSGRQVLRVGGDVDPDVVLRAIQD